MSGEWLVERCCVQEYLKNYYAEKHERSAGDKSTKSLSSSPTGSGPGHTILKKSLDHAPSGGDEGEADAAGGFCHSASLPNRHAKFRDVVEIVEFGERQRRTGPVLLGGVGGRGGGGGRLGAAASRHPAVRRRRRRHDAAAGRRRGEPGGFEGDRSAEHLHVAVVPERAGGDDGRRQRARTEADREACPTTGPNGTGPTRRRLQLMSPFRAVAV